MTRSCGECRLCCKLPANKEMGKAQNVRCSYLSNAKGCTIYPNRPLSCRAWSCRWLLGVGTEGMSRPDRVHYCIDPSPDYVTLPTTDGKLHHIYAVQVLADPAHRHTKFPKGRGLHWEPQLLAYMGRLAEAGCLVMILYAPEDFIVMLPPNLTGADDWIENVAAATEFHDRNQAFTSSEAAEAMPVLAAAYARYTEGESA